MKQSGNYVLKVLQENFFPSLKEKKNKKKKIKKNKKKKSITEWYSKGEGHICRRTTIHKNILIIKYTLQNIIFKFKQIIIQIFSKSKTVCEFIGKLPPSIFLEIHLGQESNIEVFLKYPSHFILITLIFFFLFN
jgi:hypothetical protein